VAQELELALELADLAEEIALPRFGATDLVVERKADGSPVTDADRSVERALRKRLQEARPGDAIVGEEGGASGRSNRVWYLDPIDGTSRFVASNSEWYVLIALAIDGDIVAGVATAPAFGKRWWAAWGDGAFRDGSRLRVSPCSNLAESTLCDDWDQTIARDVPSEKLAALAAACGTVRPHEGYSHLVVAEGGADLALAQGSSWDFAPVKLIVEEAGGRFSDTEGREAIDSGSSLVTNGPLHAQALQTIRAARSGARSTI
jgi:histidinol-phosphatase